jgi:primosomal protein N' (replication factor Y)
MTIRVATEFAADRLFDYAVPEALHARIRIGQRVRIPFGARTVIGYVVEILPANARETASPCPAGDLSMQTPETLFDLPEASPHTRLKPILDLESDTALLSPALIDVARWMADYYCAPFEVTLRCAMPAAIRNASITAKEQLYITVIPQEKAPAPETLKLTTRQSELLENVRRVDGGWLQPLLREFGCTTETLRKLAEKGVLEIHPKQMRRDPLANRKIIPTQPLSLMPEQAKALDHILARLNESAHVTTPIKPLLLCGVTGSGKTEVYLQAIARVLELNKGAIVLVPEIALTPQTVQRFASRFGSRIAVLHSALGDGERHDEWHRIRSGEARVVVGPRSAVFAPVTELGIIIVDEEHEPSYKQDEAPHYHARDVAIMRGHRERCLVVLGSATPSLESWLNVEKGKFEIAHLRVRVSNRPMPAVQRVDMRLEKDSMGRVQIFSDVLLNAIRLRLERGEQTILFLNRRGYASSLTCPTCGAAPTCEACDVAYTYHQADNCLRCHICGRWIHVPAQCPACGSPELKRKGLGTQRIEHVLSTCFPSARILRMDLDITTRKSSHDEILGLFKRRQADILIGTQMIAKGLDFPNVTLVGVLSADNSLNMPDFRAAERTYQLLAQVSGRAGRDELPGEVYIQTFSPDHPAIAAAASEEPFEAFAKQELCERKLGGYPPYTHLVCLTLRGHAEERVKFTADTLVRELRAATDSRKPAYIVSDACPAPLAKAKNDYRYQILMRANTTRLMVQTLRALMPRKRIPSDIKLVIDVDAIQMM